MRFLFVLTMAACTGPRLSATVSRELTYPPPLPSVQLTVLGRPHAAMQWDAQNDYAQRDLSPFADNTPAELVVREALVDDLEGRGFTVRPTADVAIECTIDSLLHTRRIYGYGWYGAHHHFAAIDAQCSVVDRGKSIWSGNAKGRWYLEGSADGDKQDMYKAVGRATQQIATQLANRLCVTARSQDAQEAQRLTAVDSVDSKLRGLLTLGLLGHPCAKPVAVDPLVTQSLHDKDAKVRAAAVLALALAGDAETMKTLAASIHEENPVVQWAIVSGLQILNVTVDFTRVMGALGPDARAALSHQ